MPTREVTSAPWAPVPARACTGKAARARQHRAVGRLSTAPAPAEVTCRGDLPAFRSDRRDRPDPVEHVPIPPRRAHRAPRPLRQLARPGCRRADACVARKVRGARADRGAHGGIRGLGTAEGTLLSAPDGRTHRSRQARFSACAPALRCFALSSACWCSSSTSSRAAATAAAGCSRCASSTPLPFA